MLGVSPKSEACCFRFCLSPYFLQNC